jgi:hypothetical protein
VLANDSGFSHHETHSLPDLPSLCLHLSGQVSEGVLSDEFDAGVGGLALEDRPCECAFEGRSLRVYVMTVETKACLESQGIS